MHRQDITYTYHGLCYTSCGAQVGWINSPLGSLNSNFTTWLHNSLFFGGPSKLRQISLNEMRTYFSFSLILRDIPNSITPQTSQTPSACYRFRSDCSYSLVPASAGGPPPPPPLPPPLFFSCPDRNWWRPVPVPMTGVRNNSLLWMCN